MIGNYVTTILSDEPQQIKMLKESKASDGVLYFIGLGNNGESFLPKHVFGIPLTEDILIRCGFEKKSHKWADGSVSENYFWLNDYNVGVDNGFCFLGKKTYDNNAQWICNIKFLHTLQNLVKLLCNQTIELK